jgi:DNA modification methylase
MMGEQPNLFPDEGLENSDSGPVTCLGQAFENNEARRVHFTDELRKKLQDPEFRKIEGFPIGEDEDILKLSDPPYYTACPNPWIAEFIEEWESQKPENPADYHYHREPFAADVSEGKNDPIYNAHSYHTKVPHKAIMRYILHYTEPGDIVFDGFCGSGMTGVAAQMCGDKTVVESLGITKESPEQKYKVQSDSTILKRQIDKEGNKTWTPFSKIGYRKVVLNDLSPIATFIAHNYNDSFDVVGFERSAKAMLKELKDELGWMYQTTHSNGKKCIIDFVVWSEQFLCPDCGYEINFLDEAFCRETKEVLSEFPCPSCSSILTKKILGRVFETAIDHSVGDTRKHVKFKPSEIHYKFAGQKFTKSPDEDDLKILANIDCKDWPVNVPINEFPVSKMYHGSRIEPKGFTHAHHFFFRRPLEALSYLWNKAKKHKCPRTSQALLFFVEQAVTSLNVQNRFGPKKYSQSNGMLPLVYYIPSQISEVTPWYVLEGKLKRLVKVFNNICVRNNDSLSGTGDTSLVKIPDNSLDYIFTDPPFGSNIFYADLNLITESWHRIFTNSINEAVVDKFKKKGLPEYHSLMLTCFKKYFMALKPGRWITVEFSNSSAAVWNAIQSTLQDAGFIVANVSALDKQQGSFRSVTTTTAVKQDLVITAYKPNGGFEERFESESQTEEGVWDFIRTHLKYLPVIKKQGYDLIAIPERDPRILYDQVIAYYVRKGYNVPIDSQEFQLGLSQRFSERDGMCFLPDQVAEYDRKKMIGGGRPLQQSLFISDEASAIEWLRSLLRNKPQSFQDVNPLFMKELSGWSKNEVGIELSILLEQNFLPYDGKGLVPDQIHAYLSSNWKELRNLTKEDAALIAKAKDRWYVPDPNKAGDLGKLREKTLLKEFEEYKQAKKKLKIFRLEAVRAGFKKAWQDRDYKVIITVAEKIPNNVLEEDPKLLMWYDQAVTRMGSE